MGDHTDKDQEKISGDGSLVNRKDGKHRVWVDPNKAKGGSHRAEDRKGGKDDKGTRK